MPAFDALFLPDGDGWLPTAATHGPWGPGLLHGGPVSALCAHVLEAASDPDFVSTRLTVDLMRPVTMDRITATSRVVKTGRRLQLLEGELTCGGKLATRASLLRLRPQSLELPEGADDGASALVDAPEDLPESKPPAALGERPFFLGAGVEARAPGGSVFDAGWGWFRLKLPVVPGAEPSPLERLTGAADFGNGISGFGDRVTHNYRFKNADLSIYVLRPPEGEWIRLQARSWWDGGGIGLARSELSDRRGIVGSAAQSLALEMAATNT